MADNRDATLILSAAAAGDAAAADQLLPLVYAELRALAASHLRRQRHDHTLQPTALVHEAFLRLIDQAAANWKSREHFYAVAALAMRQILADHARRKRAVKRGGGGAWQRVGIEQALDAALPGADLDIVALDDALQALATLDARKHKVVELRFFGGLSVDEVADVLGVSKTTVESDWRAARAWLNVELKKSG